jgi:hyperosmotically inducible periplasmic protein
MHALWRSTLLCGLVFGTLLATAASMPVTAQASANDADTAGIRADVQHELKGARFSGVHVDTQGGSLILSGQVKLLTDKLDAGKKAQKRSEGLRLKNDINVAVPENVSDQELFAKLARKLVYDRQGYGTTMFNNIVLAVKNGVVSVSGMVVTPTDKDVALNDITSMPGVRDLADNLQVAPLSPTDGRIRLAEADAIYGYPQLNRYAVDPAKPIRILVVNGHVTLEGVVDSEGDRNAAGLRANGVPGVFSVENHLRVAGQGPMR